MLRETAALGLVQFGLILRRWRKHFSVSSLVSIYTEYYIRIYIDIYIILYHVYIYLSPRQWTDPSKLYTLTSGPFGHLRVPVGTHYIHGALGIGNQGTRESCSSRISDIGKHHVDSLAKHLWFHARFVTKQLLVAISGMERTCWAMKPFPWGKSFTQQAHGSTMTF